MGKNEYYLHRSRGFAGDYFGYIGKPFKVCFLRFWLYKLFGYRATKVPSGTAEKGVILAAALNAGAHPDSYKIEKIREIGWDR